MHDHEGHDQSHHRPASRARSIVLGIVLGTAVAIAVWLTVLVLINTWEHLPRMTPADFKAAQEKWQKNGPASYSLEIDVLGREPSDVRIQVRDGEVTSMTRDGRTPEQRRVWDYWSMPGMFETIQEDLDNAEHPEKAFGVSDPKNVLFFAEFDPKLGYPKHYRREVLGSDLGLEWRIRHFEGK